VEISYLYVTIGILFLINILVSFYIAKRDDLERFQIYSQIVIVWLIPLIGAMVLWLFNRSHDAPANTIHPEGDNKGHMGGYGDSGSSSSD
jgi:hypothetical protein